MKQAIIENCTCGTVQDMYVYDNVVMRDVFRIDNGSLSDRNIDRGKICV